MAFFPLASLLDISLEGLTITVDNAKSPRDAISLRVKHTKRPQAKRCISWDGVHNRSRWSTNVPSFEETNRCAEEPVVRTQQRQQHRHAPPRRSSSLDDLPVVVAARNADKRARKSASNPRKPTRRTSPPSNLIHRKQPVVVAMNVSISDDDSDDSWNGRLPTPKIQSTIQMSYSKINSFQSDNKSSSRPLRIPTRHQSPKNTKRKSVDDESLSSTADTAKPQRRQTLCNMSTADLLAEALQEFGQ